MNDKLLNKAITLSSKEEKLQGGKPVAKIKDEKGLTYTVYKFKQDGTESIAWGQLSKLSLGTTVQIGYVEDIKDSPEYGKVTYRTIRNFNEDLAGMTQDKGEQGNSQPGANSSVSGHPDAFGRRLGVQGLSNPNYYGSAQEVSIANLVTEAIRIEDEAEKQLTPSKLRQAVNKYAPKVAEELPVIDVGEPNEDMPIEGIPF
jgi:hypothetical protein